MAIMQRSGTQMYKMPSRDKELPTRDFCKSLDASGRAIKRDGTSSRNEPSNIASAGSPVASPYVKALAATTKKMPVTAAKVMKYAGAPWACESFRYSQVHAM